MTPEERAEKLASQITDEKFNHEWRVAIIAAAIREAEGEAARAAVRSYHERYGPELELIRETLASLEQHQQSVDEAVAAEREEIATMVEHFSEADDDGNLLHPGVCEWNGEFCHIVPEKMAATIRARGK